MLANEGLNLHVYATRRSAELRCRWMALLAESRHNDLEQVLAEKKNAAYRQ